MADNENNINKTSIENFDDLSMSNFEIHSTPSVSQNKTELSITDQSNVTVDSGIQITPNLSRDCTTNNEEVSFTDSNTEITESKIMKDVEHQSTPIQNKKSDDTYEMFKAIQAMIEKQCVKFDEQKNEMRNKFDVLKFDIDEVKMKRCV